MNNEICDEKLVSMVSQELAKIGLIVPLSELESSAILSYERIREAHSLAPQTVTINSCIKDDKYYGILLNVVCADIISRYRLAHCSDGYEVTGWLSLLQKYLDNLAIVADTERQQAPVVFADILKTLSVDVVIRQAPDGGWLSQVPREKGGSHDGPVNQREYFPKHHIEVTAIDLNTGKPLPITDPITADALHKIANALTDNHSMPKNPVHNLSEHICSTCDEAVCGECSGCQSCNEVECGPAITISVNYQGECFGFRIDPGVVGLERASYTEEEWNECVGALKYAITKAGKTLAKRSGEMMTVFQKAFIREHSGEDD